MPSDRAGWPNAAGSIGALNSRATTKGIWLCISCCRLTSTLTSARRGAFAPRGTRARVCVGRAVRAHVSHFRPHRTGRSTKNVAPNPGPQSHHKRCDANRTGYCVFAMQSAELRGMGSSCALTSTPTSARRGAFAPRSTRARVCVGRAVRAHVSYFRPHRTGASTKCGAEPKLSPIGTASHHQGDASNRNATTATTAPAIPP